MKRSQVAISVILIGLSGFVLLESRSLHFGSLRSPQTGFFPTAMAVLLLLLAVILLAQALQGTAGGRLPDKILAEGWVRIGATLATMVGFAFAIERLKTVK